jgi:protein tyrosine/serine phosphatase
MSLLETTLNTRDLGGIITKDGLFINSNCIIRSDYNNILPPSQNDINYLISNKITTIIDIRSYKEIKSTKNHFESLNNFKYSNYPIEEGSEIPKTIDDVPKSYMEIACSKNIKYILEKIANSENGVLFHCSAGKDRTGVVTTIIYMLCNGSEKEIIRDYMISKENLRNKFEQLKANNPGVGVNIVIPKESYIITFVKLFNEKFGDINKYLDIIGVSINNRMKLKNKLLK